MKEGLSPDAAVRALTINAARIAGAADRLGSLEKGKIANVIVTDGDLFEDRTRVVHVFVDGRKVEPEPAAPGRARRTRPRRSVTERRRPSSAQGNVKARPNGVVFTLSRVLRQTAAARQQDRAGRRSIRRAQVFLDCASCDENYLRTEITFINYVRDRADADCTCSSRPRLPAAAAPSTPSSSSASGGSPASTRR